ncbi:MAG: DUF4065 domain-containing protein, partial [Elusimicrobia bacterium]|nr:DUF4065 domain-containing protein [Elusimicrobiota bacterium]
DVAQYILDRMGPLTTMKVQKLVYYSQAWAIVLTDRPIFTERIEAWAYGPIVPSLYNAHRGFFRISSVSDGNPGRISNEHKAVIRSVVENYGPLNAQQLSDLTHSEKPWKKARKGYAPLERCNNVIRPEWMLEYYGSLLPKTQ